MMDCRDMEATFNQMISFAQEVLADRPQTANLQAVVLKTSLGNTHTILSADPQSEQQALQQMVVQADTQVLYLVTMWQGGCLDVPAYALREKLLALNKENENALLVLQGEGHLGVRTVGSTM